MRQSQGKLPVHDSADTDGQIWLIYIHTHGKYREKWYIASFKKLKKKKTLNIGKYWWIKLLRAIFSYKGIDIYPNPPVLWIESSVYLSLRLITVLHVKLSMYTILGPLTAGPSSLDAINIFCIVPDIFQDPAPALINHGPLIYSWFPSSNSFLTTQWARGEFCISDEWIEKSLKFKANHQSRWTSTQCQ